MQNHKIRNVLFDLDGTLTDPKEGIVNSILYALDKLEIKEHDIKALDSFIGPPLRESFAARYHLSTLLADQAVVFYREYFSTKGMYENVIYPGIHELLEWLFVQNYQLFVATSKPTVYAKQIIRHFNLERYFIDVVGSNLDNTHTDKTEIIARVVSEHGLQTPNTIMVGDRKYDMIGAKNNSVKSVGVTFGYGSMEELESHQPDFMANNCEDLKSIIMNEQQMKF